MQGPAFQQGVIDQFIADLFAVGISQRRIKNTGLLVIRLINSAQGVDATYSVVLNQSNGKPKAPPPGQAAAPARSAE